MPGWTNADNKFGPSSYVVGQILGDGCNFSLIQDAINQVIADGGTGTIILRNGTYTEDLVISSAAPLNINFMAVAVDGQLAAPVAGVSIVGSHTISTTVFGIIFVESIAFESATPDIFTITPVSGDFGLGIKFCSIISSGSAAVVTAGAGVDATVSSIDSRFDTQADSITYSGAGIGRGQHYRSIFSSAANLITATSVASVQLFNCTGTAANIGISLVQGNATLRGGQYDAGQELASVASGVLEMRDLTIQCVAPSGFFATGTAATTWDYSDIVNIGTAIDFDPAMTSNPVGDWKPYGVAGAGPAPSLGTVRGTACFDSATFTVTNGFVELIGGPAASTFPVDNGGPGVPLAGSLSFLGSTSTDFPTSSGIETHVGATTNEIYFEDRRWLTEFVVDPSAVIGERGTYTTITSAIAAAGAVTNTVIYVRPGTYTESFTLTPNIFLQGVCEDGRNLYSAVSGSITVATSGATNIANMTFISGPAATFIVSAAAGGVVANLFNCTVFNSAASNAFAVSGAGGTATVNAYNCNLLSVGASCISVAGTAIFNGIQTSITCAGSNAITSLSTSATPSIFTDCFLNTSAIPNISIGAATAIVECYNSRIISTSASNISFAAAGTYRGRGNTYSSVAGSGNYVLGGAGTYRLSDEKQIGTAIGIAPGITQVADRWKPHGSAGTTGTAVRGTVGFESTQFSVTDGFVSLTGSLLVWTDQGASVAVAENSGSFATASITLTLPSTPPQGTVCEFKNDPGLVIVEAQIPDIIKLGNTISAPGGTASSTDDGDAIRLTYRAATNTWIANSVIGNWTVI